MGVVSNGLFARGHYPTLQTDEKHLNLNTSSNEALQKHHIFRAILLSQIEHPVQVRSFLSPRQHYCISTMTFVQTQRVVTMKKVETTSTKGGGNFYIT